MAVRRLAEHQPEDFSFSPENRAWAERQIAKFPAGRAASAVIPLLWRAQEQEGWVTKPAIEGVAAMLGMPTIRVLEVATFYTMFMLEPVGTAALIQVCGTTPCMLRGAGDLMDVCKKKIGPKDHLSADGRFTWQEVECLGACANAPMAQINDYYFEDLTAETMGQIIDDFAAGKSPKPGSRVGRKSSEPEGGALTLTDPKLYDGSAAQPIAKLPNSDPVPA
jgi:NADH-quinone oxidoreductase subunit E